MEHFVKHSDNSSGSFHIYISSAGSGKTRALAKAYLTLALRPDSNYFKHILAVTFTNKATQEMKERILQYLDGFTKKKHDSLSEEMLNELQLTPDELSRRSSMLLSSILHQYTQFSVTTIDSFFQRVIRAFIQDTGFLGDFRLELEEEPILQEVLKELMDNLGEDKQLTEWMIAFSRRQLMEGKDWDTLKILKFLAKEIFKEDFKQIEHQFKKTLKESNPYRQTVKTLKREAAAFERYMLANASEALTIMRKSGITTEDIKHRDQGTPMKYFLEFSKKRYFPSTGSRIQNALKGGAYWLTKEAANKSKSHAIDTRILPILKTMTEYDQQHGRKYLSIREVLKNFYALGLLADIVKKTDEYRGKNNLMLISDTPKLIQKIIQDSDVPFLYEKIGSHFRHYLIDEFQDTSKLQWKNFYPLLKDAMDQGRTNFIVGDIKQSIYRWRGGDPSLLKHEVARATDDNRIKTTHLKTNYRSARIIIQFNNIFFKKAADMLCEKTKMPFAKETFSDVEQEVGNSMTSAGYVRLSFTEAEHNKAQWKRKVLTALPQLIEELQDKKISLRDIAVLTRKKEEGENVAETLLQYRHTKGKTGYRYDVLSDESMLLEVSPSVKFLLSALQYLNNPYDTVVQAELMYQIKKEEKPELVFQHINDHSITGGIRSGALHEQLTHLTCLPLYEIIENLILIFNLGKEKNELVYLQTFQDVVLRFVSQHPGNITAFLEWWENNGHKQAITISGDVDAIKILTVHKAKGLQFKYVIIPFLNWKLDHEKAPFLWTRSEHYPLSTMGYFALNYNKKLIDTYFAEAYKEEYTKIYLDNLNLLYVSLTRAQEGIFAWAPPPKEGKTKAMNTVGELLYQSVQTDPFLSKHVEGTTFSLGTLETPKEQSFQTIHPPVTIKEYTASNWLRKLVTKQERIRSQQTDTIKNKIHYGTIVHKLLAHIQYNDQIDAALQVGLDQQWITDEEYSTLAKELKKIMQHPVISTWFEKKWNVQTEVSILLPEGNLQRIDRLMTHKNRTIVVDYKTGRENQQDQIQISHYLSILQQMGYHCEGFLLYLQPIKIVKIN